jgi:hypothetical protein
VAHHIQFINNNRLQFFPHIFTVLTTELIFKLNIRRPKYMS